MKTLSQTSQKTLNQLIAKSNDDSVRMASIKNIATLFEELGFMVDYTKSVNVVSYKNSGSRFVNSRHNGKVGNKLTVYSLQNNVKKYEVELDSSDSYYSYNTYSYAQKLVKLASK